MPWFRLDDSFHSHPKVIAAGNEAIGLYVRCGTYAAEHLTDGFIPEHVVLLYGSRPLADALVRTKLWRRTRGGWNIPDYLDYNPSAIQVKQERQNAAERQRRRREAMVSRRDSQGDSRRESHDPDPTRPDPNTSTANGRPKRAGSPLAGTGKRGTRLPPEWMPSRDLVTWAVTEYPFVDSREQTDWFRDYWAALAGPKAVKLDWDATWKNWIRRAAESPARSRGRHTRSTTDDRIAMGQALKAQLLPQHLEITT